MTTTLDFNNDDKKSEKVFNFLADHTGVVWSLTQYKGSESSDVLLNTITSGHNSEHEPVGSTFAISKALQGLLVYHTHNHPGVKEGEPGSAPSQTSQTGSGDRPFRDAAMKESKNARFFLRVNGNTKEYTDKRMYPTK